MAFSVRVEVIKWPATGPMLTLEPNWWDAKALQDDKRFVDIEDTPGYWDCQASLTAQEFKYLNDRFRKKANDPPILAMLDAALEHLTGEDDRFLVTVFEWFSGYGD